MIESTDQRTRLELTLANLDCEKDAARISTGLGTLPGLSDIAVAPKAGQVSLRFDSQIVSADTIKGTLGDLGFPPTDGCGCGDTCSSNSLFDLPPEQEQRLRRRA